MRGRPKKIENWLLTSLQQPLVKTGGRLVKHARYYWLMLAESHLTGRLCGSMLRRIGAADSGERVKRGDETRTYTIKEVMVGEVFVECAEKAEFPSFGFLPQAKTAPFGNRTRLPKKKTEPGGLKEADCVYTDPVLGAKMEILAQTPARTDAQRFPARGINVRRH